MNDFTQFFAQDQWTAGRLTLQGGIRFEYISSFYPEAVIGQDVFVPQTLVFPAQDAGVGPKDINPRVGVAYDLFGNGKTAFKFSLGRYPTPTNCVRDLWPLAAAVLPRGHVDQPLVERSAPSGRRPASGQFLAGLRPAEHGRERRVWRRQPELRTGGVCHDLRSRDPQWLEHPRVQLGSEHRRAARDRPACLRRDLLREAQLGEPDRHRQSRLRAGGLRSSSPSRRRPTRLSRTGVATA